MAYSDERLEQIFDRTCGDCHICGGRLAFCNYAAYGKRGAWEVEHSKPKREGGTDHLNNLYPAHISCNRSKQDTCTRKARAKYGRTKAPLSSRRRAEAKSRNATDGAFIGGTLGGLIGGFWGAVIGAAIGGKSGYDTNLDD
jgi:5-methylcytosine-specific restriction endonuclease McrA